MKKLSFLILFLFICSFCNAQEGHNFTVKEIDSIAKKTEHNLVGCGSIIKKGFLGKRAVGSFSDNYYYYLPVGSSKEILVKKVYSQNITYKKLFNKYSIGYYASFYYKNQQLFYVSVKKIKYKKDKKVDMGTYKCYINNQSDIYDNFPEDIKDIIETESK